MATPRDNAIVATTIGSAASCSADAPPTWPAAVCDVVLDTEMPLMDCVPWARMGRSYLDAVIASAAVVAS